VHDFTKPWSNDFPAVTPEQWRAVVERGQPGRLDGLASEIEPGLVCPPLAHGGQAASPRPERGETDWATAQQYDLRAPEEVARRVRADADFGLQSAWIRLDPALRAGARPRGVVRSGVRIASEDDAATLLEATEAQGMALWIEAGASGRVVTDLFARACVRLGLDPLRLRGAVLCDPLATLAETGCLRSDLATALGDLVHVARGAKPAAATVEVSTVPHHDAGATAAQEIAFMVATGLLYLRALDDAGMTPAEAMPRFVFRLPVGTELFVEIAKLRAARWLWGRVADKCGVAAAPMRLSVRTAWRNRTRMDPWVNLLRGTVESFAAVVGGADELVVGSLTEPIGAADADARRWALHTQSLLRHEAHLGRVRDPAGGSAVVEALTLELADRAWALVRRIEASGGMAEALLLGEIDAWVAEAAESRRQTLATGAAALVGTTLHPDFAEVRMEAEVVEGCEAMPAEAGLEVPPLPLHRLAEPYEALREAGRAHRARTGVEPTVLLVMLDDHAKAGPSLGRARTVLGLGGFSTREVSVQDAVQIAEDEGHRTAVVCGVDEIVRTQGPPVVEALRGAGATRILATVTSRETDRVMRDAGVDACIEPDLDVPELLADLQRAMGVTS
jgi:methylmalonyl-CoA mutase